MIQPSESLWFPAITNRPAGQVVRAGWLGQKIVTVGLAEVAAAGTSQPTATFQARIINPSRKLGCGFAVLFRPATGQTVVTWTASVWTPRGFEPTNGAPLHVLESSIAVPRMYEMETYSPGVIVTGTLGVPVNATPATVPGTWELIVRWEPCMPMCDDEALAIYGACSAGLDFGPSAPLVP